MESMTTTRQKPSFQEWMRAVDNALFRLIGIDSDGLPDWYYRDDYNDNYSPERTARRVVAHARTY